jgi:hypothetical protein
MRLFHTIEILICEMLSIEESDSLDVVQIGSYCALLLRAKAESVILHVHEVVARKHLYVIAYDQTMSFFGLEPYSRLNVFWLPRTFHKVTQWGSVSATIKNITHKMKQATRVRVLNSWLPATPARAAEITPLSTIMMTIRRSWWKLM